MHEKRKFTRCNVDQDANISRKPDQQEPGLLLDISMGGMKIMLDEEVQIGNQLSGKFKLLPSLGPFTVQGVVVWSKPMKQDKSERWEVGIKFTQVKAV